VGRRLAEVVTSRPKAAAYRLKKVKGKVVETRLETRYLGIARGRVFIWARHVGCVCG
jgi:hypothetical protein